LFDPAVDERDFSRGQLASGIRGWHLYVGIFAADSDDKFTLARPAFDDGGRLCVLFDVQSQIGRSMRCIRAVTGKAIVCQDGAYIAIEVDSLSPE
jgi:hypothetical protein